MCEEKECVETVAVNPAWDEYCVNVSGELEKIAVKSKEEYCVHQTKESSYSEFDLLILVSMKSVSVKKCVGTAI